MSEPMIRVSCVRHTYPDRTEVHICGLDFVVEKGRRVVVLGEDVRLLGLVPDGRHTVKQTPLVRRAPIGRKPRARGNRFEKEVIDLADYQGCPVGAIPSACARRHLQQRSRTIL